MVRYEPEYPNLLFSSDCEVFDLEEIKHLSIGGAYSVDKEHRLERGYKWWPDEQPLEKIKTKVEETLERIGWKIDIPHTPALTGTSHTRRFFLSLTR